MRKGWLNFQYVDSIQYLLDGKNSERLLTNCKILGVTISVVIGTAAQLKSDIAAFTSVTVAGSSLVSHWTVSCGSTVTPERSPRKAPTTCTLCVMCATCWCPTIACSNVVTRIDYCNSLLYGAPATTFYSLQRVQTFLLVPEAAALSRCLSRYTGYPWVRVLLTNWHMYATRSTSTPGTARTIRPLSTTVVKPRTKAGRSSNSHCFLPAVLSLSLHRRFGTRCWTISSTRTPWQLWLKTHLFHCVMRNVLATERLGISYYGAIQVLPLYCTVLFLATPWMYTDTNH